VLIASKPTFRKTLRQTIMDNRFGQIYLKRKAWSLAKNNFIVFAIIYCSLRYWFGFS